MTDNKRACVSPPKRKELSDTPVKFCNEIARLFRDRMRSVNSSDGVMSQPGAHLVLSMLAINDGIKQMELVTNTHLKAPSVSVILQKMELEGIVERRRDDAEDMRAVRVYLTEYGRELDKMHIETIKKIDALALDGFDDGEIALLMKLLPRIRDNLLYKNEKGERDKTE